MLLNDTEIRHKIQNNNLIANFDENNIESCSYIVRVGQAFKPMTGEFVDMSNNCIFTIKPSEGIIIMTKETINTPDNICADYSIKNSLASQGLMLLNACIVLPGYSGPLSCFLVNFSDRAIPIAINDGVARIIFHTIHSPQKINNQTITSQQYQTILAKNATAFSTSFMNIGELKNAVLAETGAQIRKNINWGGIVIGMLLLWSTLEPLVLKKIWGGEVYVTNQKHDLDLLKKDFDQHQKDFDDEMKNMKKEFQILVKQYEDDKSSKGNKKAMEKP